MHEGQWGWFHHGGTVVRLRRGTVHEGHVGPAPCMRAMGPAPFMVQWGPGSCMRDSGAGPCIRDSGAGPCMRDSGCRLHA